MKSLNLSADHRAAQMARIHELADLDRQEQEARIAVLHKQAAASEASGGTIIVQIEGLEELAM